MQLIVILALVGAINIAGVAVTSEQDLNRRGVSSSEYQSSVEVEDVSSKPDGSLLEALSN